MELRHLRYFVAVAEELHFRRAAERLYVAQPAVSEQIRKLEAELGVRLFDRTHRSVALTASGSALLVEARRVLHQAEIAQRAARDAHASAGSKLRIGYVPDALPASVPRALQALASEAPHVEVVLQTGATHRAHPVRPRRAARRRHRRPPRSRQGAARHLARRPVAGRRRPCRSPMAFEPELTLERLAPERLVMLPRDSNPALHDAVVALTREAGLSPVFVEAPEPRVEAVLLAVAAGGGVALLPASVAQRYATRGRPARRRRRSRARVRDGRADAAGQRQPRGPALPARGLARGQAAAGHARAASGRGLTSSLSACQLPTSRSGGRRGRDHCCWSARSPR